MNFKEFFKLSELGVGPYIGKCIDTDNYVVMGACSDQNTDAKNRSISAGNVAHKMRKKKLR